MNQQVFNAAQMNQIGASCLAANQLEQAQKCFQSALESVTLAGFDVSILDGSQQQANMKSLMVSQQGLVSRTTAQHDKSESYIYSKPFFFNPEATLTQEGIAPYGGVILFNLALTFHERSRVVGESALRVALQLYEKCITLLRHASAFDCSNVIIAALNNQARIHEELLDFAKAGMNFKMLSDFLNHDGVRTDTLEQEDLQEIFLNLFFFKLPTCAPVA